MTFGYAASGKAALAAGSVVATVRFTAKSALPATRLTVTVEDFNAREGPPSGAARCACGRAALYGRVRGRLVLRCGGLCVAGGPLPGDG